MTVTSRMAELADLDVETPAYVYDELVMEEEIAAARKLLAPAGARLLLAMKAFSFEPGLRHVAPLLDGFHASSVFEARLARDVSVGGTVHSTTPGLRDRDAEELADLSDRLSFNSLGQLRRHLPAVASLTSPGIRVNPGLSFVSDERFDPAARNSKLGVPVDELRSVVSRTPEALDGVEGLLAHANSESTHFSDLLQVVDVLVERLDPLLRRLRWVNLGGGYLFSEAEDADALERSVHLLRDAYDVEVLFEPGLSLVNSAGALVTTVVDVFHSGGKDVAVLDTSVSHVPEVLDFQWVPDVARQDGCHRYVLAGGSCLAGDLFGEHCFHEPVEVGSRLVLTEVGAYSLVKASWFNGMALPTVYSRTHGGGLRLQRRYTYDDFASLNRGDHAYQ